MGKTLLCKQNESEKLKLYGASVISGSNTNKWYK